MANEIAFRRIKGRVVPIRTNRKNIAEGSALVAAGVGAGVGAGKYAGRLTLSSSMAENTARSLGRTARAQIAAKSFKATKTGILAMHWATTALRYSRRAAVVKKVGVVAASALLGSGINQILKATPLHDDEKTRTVAAGAAGVGAALTFKSTYSRELGARGLTWLKHATKGLLKVRF